MRLNIDCFFGAGCIQLTLSSYFARTPGLELCISATVTYLAGQNSDLFENLSEPRQFVRASGNGSGRLSVRLNHDVDWLAPSRPPLLFQHKP